MGKTQVTSLTDAEVYSDVQNVLACFRNGANYTKIRKVLRLANDYAAAYSGFNFEKAAQVLEAAKKE